MKRLLILLLVFYFGKSFAADSMILVHGYSTDIRTWDKNSITEILAHDGWQVAGYAFFDYRYGVYLNPLNTNSGKNIYIIQMPYRAPVFFQAQVLEDLLGKVSKLRPDDNIHLVGHSVGGVVGRMVAVNNKFAKIKTLITIASPHFGTRRAEMALDFTDLPFPFSEMAEVGGGTEYDKFQDSEDLFRDLVRPRPGTFLNWLNWMPHPDINYYSIVRKKKNFFSKDFLVPSISQDMGLIPALHGKKTRTLLSGKSHGLNGRDGIAISRIMQEVLNTKQ